MPDGVSVQKLFSHKKWVVCLLFGFENSLYIIDVNSLSMI
jgi:hypothetical protein